MINLGIFNWWENQFERLNGIVREEKCSIFKQENSVSAFKKTDKQSELLDLQINEIESKPVQV